MAKVIYNYDAGDSAYENIRCPYCMEYQMSWEYSRKGHVLYGRNGLPHDCKELDLIMNKGKYNEKQS